ncbi:MAG: STAS domain-containing protein [Desulfovibrio sp.]|nr:STAS domain-containing protein [Desulfovibrio sp.]
MYALEVLNHGTTLTVRLTGDVLMEDVASFNKVMREHSKTPGISQLVLDLGATGRMEVAGLGVLVSLNTSMQRYGRRLVLLGPAPHVTALLQKAEIEGFFPTCESEEELRNFIPEACAPAV